MTNDLKVGVSSISFSTGLHVFCSSSFLYGNLYPLGYLCDALQYFVNVRIFHFIHKVGTRRVYVFAAQKYKTFLSK